MCGGGSTLLQREEEVNGTNQRLRSRCSLSWRGVIVRDGMRTVAILLVNTSPLLV